MENPLRTPYDLGRLKDTLLPGIGRNQTYFCKQTAKDMYPKPIDEYLLLRSLPGFDGLSDDEKLLFRVTSFEYSGHPSLTMATLLFSYGESKLTFELSCSRKEGFCFHHVLLNEDGGQKEFPSFRSAIDYCHGTAQVDQ